MAASEKIPININLRVQVALGICAAVFFVILLRLWYLQILKGDYFREQSENNRIRTVFVPPRRGLIVDRHEVVLVKNRPSFDIELITEDSPDPRTTVRRLAELTGQDPDQLYAKLGTQRKRRRFEPKLLLRDVSRDILAKVAVRRYELPGVQIAVNPARDYAHKTLAAHVVGYIREITRGQLDSSAFSLYRQGDLVGQYGVERKWEHYLQGVRGMRRVIVNAAGNRIGESSFSPERPGNNMTLTLDFETQQAADRALADAKGAIVVLDVKTGEVLAMASSPTFDPNMFVGEVDPDAWAELISGKAKRLNNRAVQGSFPPASVFKIFMAVAGLSEKVVTPNTTFHCPGFMKFGSRAFRCHKKSGHGTVNLYDAMVQSCDVYFYNVGILLGVDRIHDYATRFGLGRMTGLNLVHENPGIIPSTEWKRRYFRRPEDQKWYPGETLSVAIGQGAVTTTPLQIARALAALVNGGLVLRPHLVRRIESTSGSLRDEAFGPEIENNLDVDPKILKTVRDALIGVVNDPRGTGRRAQLDQAFSISVGGKTGTAQVTALGVGKGADFHDHAWFSGYAPADNPEIVAVALVENGGHGGVAAAPMVRQVMEAYFRDRRRVETAAPVAGRIKPPVAVGAPAPVVDPDMGD